MWHLFGWLFLHPSIWTYCRGFYMVIFFRQMISIMYFENGILLIGRTITSSDILLLSLFSASNSKQQSFGNDVSKIGATSMLVKIRTLIFPTHFHWQTALPSIKIKMNELDGIKSNKSEFFKTSDQKLRKSRKSLRTLCTYTWKLSFSCSIKRFLNWSWLWNHDSA